MTTSFLRTLCVVVCLQGGATAQFIWRPVATTGPSGRFNHAMAYDSQRGRTVLFGGGTSTADTWDWDGIAWQQRSSAATGPSARNRHAMTFDIARGKIVMFGGSPGGPGPLMADTWEWDGVVWTQVASIGPSARHGHAMTYDSSRGRAVMFGGRLFDGSILGDTWEWDGSVWTNVATSGPSARMNHAMAYDSQRGQVVLFGGYDGTTAFGDTWEWNGAGWSPRGGGPPPRKDHVMAFDAGRARTVLFAGSAPGSFWAFADTWEWDGSSWAQISTTGPSGIGLWNRSFAMAYDSLAGHTVMFGGFGSGGPVSDTWIWADPPAATASTYGSGCSNPALALLPDVSALPTIGTIAQASLVNVPSSLAFVALGWSRTVAGPFQLPIPLDGYGMTGCLMLQSTDVLGQPATLVGLGTATYGLPVPFQPSLIGLHIYLQGWAVAPGANPANITVSNGLDWLIGY